MSRPLVFTLSLALTAGLFATSAPAADVPPAMADFIEQNLQGWIDDPAIITAIQAQNIRTGTLSQAEIDDQDQKWRAQVGQAEQPLIGPVISSDLAGALKDRVNASSGRITEVFVMDARGLNVAASAVTSDYWQGDESKFSETYMRGPGAVFIDDVELDESTQRYQGQVSFTITDPDTGSPVGAITVGLDASAFY